MNKKKNDMNERVEALFEKLNYDWDKIEDIATKRMMEINRLLTEPYHGTLGEAREILRITDLMTDFIVEISARVLMHKMEVLHNDA